MDGADNTTTFFSRCVALVRDPPASLSHVRLTDDQKLKLYAMYKQRVEGDNSTTCPGLLDFVGRAKWNAWKALVGLSKAEAQAQYVACVRAWYGDDAVTSSSSTSTPFAPRTTDTAYHSGGGRGGGTSENNFSFGSNQVRALGAIGVDGLIAGSGGGRREGGREEGGEGDEDEEEAEAHAIFYYAKRGMVEKVVARLDEGGKEGEEEVNIDIRDEEGRTLLHWAVDGNHQVLVELLLARGADVTTKDGEGETPLDYARLCEHEALVEVLVKWEGGGGEEGEGWGGGREGGR